MKNNPELTITSAIAGVSAVLLLAACQLVLNLVPYSSLPAWGVWLAGLSLAAGFAAMLCARNYGVLVGAAVPGLLLAVLGLHWSLTGGEVKRGLALAMACGGFWVFLWIGSQMLASAFRSSLGMRPGKTVFASAAVLLLLSKALAFIVARSGAQGVHVLEIALAAWLAALLIWRPSLTLRTLGLILSHTLYRIRIDRIENYPDSGPVLLVANHISFLDFIFILCLKPRRVTFMVDETFYRFPGLHLFFKWSGALEVPRGMNREKMRRLIEQSHTVLNRGGAVCVFPEGAISPNGITHAFRSGLHRLMPSPDIPVIPVRLGLHWGSLLTIYNGKLRFIKPRLLPIPGTIIVGEPIPPDWNGFRIWQRIQELGAEAEMKPVRGEKTVHYRYLRRSLQHPFESTFKDADAPKGLSNFAMLAQSIIISRKLRQILAERGDDGQFVGVLLPNKAVSVAVLLGVMFADRTPAILNYTAGDAVMQSMYDRAKLKTVITSRLFLSKLKKPTRDEMFFLEDLPKLVTKADKLLTAAQIVFLPHQLLIRVVSPRYGTDLMRPAALLFSSGSTGMPKGILLSHHNITANIWSFWRQLNWLYGTERILGNLPLFHAFGLMVGLCFPGVTGTKVTLVANPLDGAGVCKAVRDDKVTMLISTPTFLQTYMRNCKPGDFDSLRMMVTGAEKLQKRLADAFFELTGLHRTAHHRGLRLHRDVADRVAEPAEGFPGGRTRGGAGGEHRRGDAGYRGAHRRRGHGRTARPRKRRSAPAEIGVCDARLSGRPGRHGGRHDPGRLVQYQRRRVHGPRRLHPHHGASFAVQQDRRRNGPARADRKPSGGVLRTRGKGGRYGASRFEEGRTAHRVLCRRLRTRSGRRRKPSPRVRPAEPLGAASRLLLPARKDPVPRQRQKRPEETARTGHRKRCRYSARLRSDTRLRKVSRRACLPVFLDFLTKGTCFFRFLRYLFMI